MIRRFTLTIFVALFVALGLLASTSASAEEKCTLEPRAACFGIESVKASLSKTEAGAHPDVTFSVEIRKDPESKPNGSGLNNSYATTRNIRINLPPGLIGDPNVLGAPQQCSTQELLTSIETGGCPNGSQVGITTISTYRLGTFREPLYMMQPPSGDVVARVGLIAATLPVFIDLSVRSEGDYGLVADVRDAPAAEQVLKLETTIWGVPAEHSHDNERCTAKEAFNGCIVSESRPPGSLPLPFMTNPTRCGVPLTMGVNASSWLEPTLDPAKEVKASFPTISGCNKLPFGPALRVEPTSRRPASPTGLDITIRLPASKGIDVLEPAQMRDIRILFPEGLITNAALGDGLDVCSIEQVHFGERVDAECPDAAKIADTEFDIPVLSRRMRGAVYLREPEPGNPFRIWVVADDLGVHVKLAGQLDVDKQTGQIESIVLDAPQAPLREVTIKLKSGFRAPLINPSACGTYRTQYEFIPWSGGPPATGNTQMTIDQGCGGLGGFAPELSAGTVDAAAGQHSPFVFSLNRDDGEQNLASFDISLPRGLTATFAGLGRCNGEAAKTGACPADSRVGKVVAAIGAGPTPLWVPQSGKRPTAIYLSGPYKGAPLSIVAVVPRQAGPFDFGDEVVRSAVSIDPVTARATARTDPLPQIIEGIPIGYRKVHVDLDRPGFSLNPTSCAPKATEAIVTSAQGAFATPTSPFEVVNCAKLPFKPKFFIRLAGGTHRGSHPKLTATVRMPSGGANLDGIQVLLPRSEFIENSHFKTICTRVQFAAKACPPDSIYGFAVAKTPLLDEPLKGPVYLRSSSHLLPDLVTVLKGPASLPIEIVASGKVDSVRGGLRTTFKAIPDAPVSEISLHMQGGSKGLIVNSTNLCASVNRASAKFSAQNGKVVTLHPALQNSCKNRARTGKSKKRHSG